jgi:hypothetical protein
MESWTSSEDVIHDLADQNFYIFQYRHSIQLGALYPCSLVWNGKRSMQGELLSGFGGFLSNDLGYAKDTDCRTGKVGSAWKQLTGMFAGQACASTCCCRHPFSCGEDRIREVYGNSDNSVPSLGKDLPTLKDSTLEISQACCPCCFQCSQRHFCMFQAAVAKQDSCSALWSSKTLLLLCVA